MIELVVNGRPRQLQVDPAAPLIFVLRNDLNLKSVRLGCGLEQCGSCKVMVDGEAVMSCARSVAEFAGKSITTVEGFADDGRLNALQQAFYAHNAAQCGYCLSGVLIAVEALLRQHAQPTEAQIVDALRDNLCRCGAQPRMLRAIRATVAASQPAQVP